MSAKRVSLAEKFAQFDDTWEPKIVGELNDFHVKIVKLDGEFVWHHHEVEDELFWVIAGRLNMQLRDERGERTESIGPGEFIIVPHGVEHCPAAQAGTQIVLLEPKTTVNTGSAPGERTRESVWL